MTEYRFKEILIAIFLLLFGVHYILVGVYNTINFELLYIEPGVLYSIYPSATRYFIPLSLLGLISIISGILILVGNRFKTYFTNIALVGVFLELFSEICDFSSSAIDSATWIISGTAVSALSLYYLNHSSIKTKKQIGIKFLMLCIGLAAIYLGPSLIYLFD